MTPTSAVKMEVFAALLRSSYFLEDDLTNGGIQMLSSQMDVVIDSMFSDATLDGTVGECKEALHDLKDQLIDYMEKYLEWQENGGDEYSEAEEPRAEGPSDLEEMAEKIEQMIMGSGNELTQCHREFINDAQAGSFDQRVRTQQKPRPGPPIDLTSGSVYPDLNGRPTALREGKPITLTEGHPINLT